MCVPQYAECSFSRSKFHVHSFYCNLIISNFVVPINFVCSISSKIEVQVVVKCANKPLFVKFEPASMHISKQNYEASHIFL